MVTGIETSGPTLWIGVLTTALNLIIWAGIVYVGVLLVRVLHKLLRRL